ncbi:MAG: YwbE family protein [Ruminococcaceae bacterium]|nr:YwbE family protein [Oscillospiraceae bacterium]
MDGKRRSDIAIGALVEIVLKKDQPTGKLTKGRVKRILTNSPTHPHGIKVMLEENDMVGRVQKILDEPPHREG